MTDADLSAAASLIQGHNSAKRGQNGSGNLMLSRVRDYTLSEIIDFELLSAVKHSAILATHRSLCVFCF